MIGAMMGAMGGGGMSASSSASASQETSTSSGFGAVNMGGLNMGKSGRDESMQMTIIAGVVVVGLFLFMRKK
jgi:hypothetical protein